MRKKVCVFLSSRDELAYKFRETVFECVDLCKKNNYDIVYGGANRGLMGLLADTALSLGISVYGVIPYFLKDIEVAHQSLTEIYFVKNMLERKEKMAELSDAFLVLPGGLGTMDELFEMLTWSQLKIHEKRISLYNAYGIYDGISHYFDQALKEKFLSEKSYDYFKISSNLEELFSFIGERL